jgi:hypothetical protein
MKTCSIIVKILQLKKCNYLTEFYIKFENTTKEKILLKRNSYEKEG